MTTQRDYRTAFGDILKIVLKDIVMEGLPDDDRSISSLLLEVKDNNGRRHIFTIESKNNDFFETYRNLDIFSKEITTTSNMGGK